MAQASRSSAVAARTRSRTVVNRSAGDHVEHLLRDALPEHLPQRQQARQDIGGLREALGRDPAQNPECVGSICIKVPKVP